MFIHITYVLSLIRKKKKVLCNNLGKKKNLKCVVKKKKERNEKKKEKKSVYLHFFKSKCYNAWKLLISVKHTHTQCIVQRGGGRQGISLYILFSCTLKQQQQQIFNLIGI